MATGGGPSAAGDFDPSSGATWRSVTRRPESVTTRRSIKDFPVACAYFFPAGHVLSYEEETEALELNPAAALQTLMDHIEALARKRVETNLE